MVRTDNTARASWLGAGLALFAIGAVLAFAFTGEVLGLDVDVLGWMLMTVGLIAVVASGVRRLRRSDSHE